MQKTEANTSLKHPALSIPNILSYIRLALIPAFVLVYWNASCKSDYSDYYIAAAIVAISGITDCLDGFIARRFNMITELGKFIDPLADKMTQLALIVCFVIKYPMMWILVGIYVVKEGYMAVMALVTLKKKNRKLKGAKWYGKVCTTILFIIMFVLMVFPEMPVTAANILILICAGAMIMAFVGYLPLYIKLWKGELDNKRPE